MGPHREETGCPTKINTKSKIVLKLKPIQFNSKTEKSTSSKILDRHRRRWVYLWQRSARVVFSISRREWDFLHFNLFDRDKTENSWRLLSGFKTRPRKNFLQSWASRRDRDLLSSLSGFETITIIPLIWSRFSRRDREFWNLPSFPEIRLERPHYFACNFWEANYIKCRAPHFARCSPILKWPSHVLRASILWFFRLLP